jgi:hypothetical protein
LAEFKSAKVCGSLQEKEGLFSLIHQRKSQLSSKVPDRLFFGAFRKTVFLRLVLGKVRGRSQLRINLYKQGSMSRIVQLLFAKEMRKNAAISP